MIGGQQNVLAHPEQTAPFAILYVIEYLCHVNITDLLCLECCAFAALLSNKRPPQDEQQHAMLNSKIK